MIRTATAALLLAVLALPLAAQQEDHELVLVPVFLHGQGANGSRWETELSTFNPTPEWVQTEDGGALPCQWLIDPCPFGAIAPRAHTFVASTEDLTVRGGFTLRVPRPAADQLVYSLRVFEETGATGDMGVSVPVVRERDLRSGPVQILNVPLSFGIGLPNSGFRELLRVYAIGDAASARAILRAYLDDRLLLTKEITLTRSGSSRPHLYAEESMLFDEMKAGIDAPMRIRIEIEGAAAEPALLWWGMVSITNNETQQVSVVTSH